MKREQIVRHFPATFPENSDTIEFPKSEALNQKFGKSPKRDEMGPKFPDIAVPFIPQRKFEKNSNQNYDANDFKSKPQFVCTPLTNLKNLLD